MELIDTHVHLDFPQFEGDREEVIERALAAGVWRIINVGTDLASSRRAVALAEAHPQIYAAVGVHPHDAKTLTDKALTELRELARHPRVVAIGEIGLDFYRDLSPRDIQREALEQQLALAQELGKPVVIHDREAHAEVMEILRRRQGLRGVLHCFSGSLEMAREAIELGFHISVAGPVTFENARRLLEIVRQLPLERLLIETDCPYLAPHPHRGRRNEPAYVRLVAQRIATLKEVPLETVAHTTTDNARALFGLE
ncbi:MAG: TatD family hydrolase [Chloroflexota bacterium]|nr:TatD family hydrolase [Chloroflexota bacterium]